MNIYHFNIWSIDNDEESEVTTAEYLTHTQLFSQEEFKSHAKVACDHLLEQHKDRLKYITGKVKTFPFTVHEIMDAMISLFDYQAIHPHCSLAFEETYERSSGWKITDTEF